jgi:bifunctional DNase/RNase
MELIAVRVDLPGNTPVLVFREIAGVGRLLPIFIGQPEATAIAFAMDGVVTPRPMTHDLLAIVIAELGATLEQVTITHVDQGTFHAELLLRAGDREHRVSSRPSDAVALALRAECPIWAAESVVDEAGLLPDDEDDESEPAGEDVVDQFREFIDNVNPDDFAS